MKKKILVIVAISLFVICCIIIVLRINGINSNSQKKNEMIGIYLIANIKEMEKTYTKEEIERIKNDYKIIIFNNNQAEFHFKDATYISFYDGHCFIIHDNKGNEISLEYKYNKNTITINYYSGVYVFKK